MKPLFRDRHDAGKALAAKLLIETAVVSQPVILALPRGGVPVAFEVAGGFRAPLDVLIVRPLEVPGSSGAVMGAISSDHVLVLEPNVIAAFEVSEKAVTRVVRKEARELARREKAYRGDRSAAAIGGRTVILVDDGLATAATLLMAIAAIRARMPERLIVAMPVAADDGCHELASMVDDLICLEVPKPFRGVGAWYDDFSEVSDLDVRRLHAAAREREQARSFPN